MARYITPAITPLTEKRQIDEEAVFALYDHLVQGGVDGILTLGSIGEFFALPMNEKKHLVRAAVQACAHRLPLLVGTGSTVLSDVLELSEEALSRGADAVIIVPPYYFSHTAADMEAWYGEIARRIPGRIYLYNFPDRTGYAIAPETVLRLRQQYENIVGIKDTISGMDHTRELIDLIKPQYPDFEIYSGFDDNFAHNVLSGGDGCIAGLSNVLPGLCSAWRKAAEQGNMKQVAEMQQKVNRLMRIYGVGSPFVPFIKAATALMGVPVSCACTAPLPVPTREQIDRIADILRQEGFSPA